MAMGLPIYGAQEHQNDRITPPSPQTPRPPATAPRQPEGQPKIKFPISRFDLQALLRSTYTSDSNRCEVVESAARTGQKQVKRITKRFVAGWATLLGLWLVVHTGLEFWPAKWLQTKHQWLAPQATGLSIVIGLIAASVAYFGVWAVIRLAMAIYGMFHKEPTDPPTVLRKRVLLPLPAADPRMTEVLTQSFGWLTGGVRDIMKELARERFKTPKLGRAHREIVLSLQRDAVKRGEELRRCAAIHEEQWHSQVDFFLAAAKHLDSAIQPLRRWAVRAERIDRNWFEAVGRMYCLEDRLTRHLRSKAQKKGMNAWC